MYVEELFTNNSTNIERTLANYSSSIPRIMNTESDIDHYKCNHR
jgi:hypothetical protein